MPRARNKEDLLQFSEENYSKLLKMISAMSENQMSTEFDFSLDFENGNGLSILIGNNGSGKSNVIGLYSGEDLRLWENFYLQRYLEYLTSVYRRGFTGKMGMYYVNKSLEYCSFCNVVI